MNIVIFTLAGKVFGADIRQVGRVIRIREITPVPDAAPFVEGVISFRRKVVPLINLKRKFGFPDDGPVRHARILMAHVHGQMLGVLVDDVLDVRVVGPESVVAPDEVLRDAHYLTGVVKIGQYVALLLDMEKILDAESRDRLLDIGNQVEVR